MGVEGAKVARSVYMECPVCVYQHKVPRPFANYAPHPRHANRLNTTLCFHEMSTISTVASKKCYRYHDVDESGLRTIALRKSAGVLQPETVEPRKCFTIVQVRNPLDRVKSHFKQCYPRTGTRPSLLCSVCSNLPFASRLPPDYLPPCPDVAAITPRQHQGGYPACIPILFLVLSLPPHHWPYIFCLAQI